MRKILLLMVALLAIAVNGAAQHKKAREAKVRGSYTYTIMSDEDISMVQAKRKACERARLDAIAAEFGTMMSESNTTHTVNDGNVSTTRFTSLGSAEVRGVWLEDLDEPEYKQGLDSDGNYTVTATVHGRVREIVSAETPIDARILRNGTAPRFESVDFRSNDEMYLYFKSPQAGFLAVYLIDESLTAYCLLPYSKSKDAVQAVETDREYIFFSAKDAPAVEKAVVDEYTLTCDGDMERNDFYIVYSPNRFTKANSSQKEELLPRELPWDEFNKWLSKLRRQDEDMVIKQGTVVIKK